MSVKVESKSGGMIELSTNPETGYGFKPGQIVHFNKSLRNGKVALIRGTHEGLLWFSVFPTADEASTKEALSVPVDSVSCRVREELIRQYGWDLDDKVNPYV